MQKNTKIFQWSCTKRKGITIRRWKTRGHQTRIKAQYWKPKYFQLWHHSRGELEGGQSVNIHKA